MRTLTLNDRDVTMQELEELEIFTFSRWLTAKDKKILVVTARYLGEDFMPIRLKILDLINEVESEVHPADFARWVQEKKFAKFTIHTWTVPELYEPIPQAS